MVFHPRVLRSRHDDIFVGISDTERRQLTGRCVTRGRELATQAAVPSIESFDMALFQGEWANSEISKVLGPLRLRNSEVCHHSRFSVGCLVSHTNLDESLREFYEWTGKSVTGFLTRQSTDNGPGIDEIATFYAELYQRLLTIVPVGHGNLLITEAYICWASFLLNVAPARRAEPLPGEPFDSERDETNTSMQQRKIERDAYDQAIASALAGDTALLAQWFDDRMKRWQEADRSTRNNRPVQS